MSSISYSRNIYFYRGAGVTGCGGGGGDGATELNELSDVSITTPAEGHVLIRDDSNFKNRALNEGDITNLLSNLASKQDTLTFDTQATNGSDNNVLSSNVIFHALEGKQDVLTFDTQPTNGSVANVLSSNVLFHKLGEKQDTLTFDTEPTQSSSNPITSDAVYQFTSQFNLASQPNLQGGELISYDLGGTTWNSISTKVSDLLTTSSNIGDLNDVNAPSPAGGSVIYYSAHNEKYSTADLYTIANSNNLIDNTLTDTASNKFAHAGKVAELLGEKQDTLTFDTEPTQSSSNPITSDAVYQFTSQFNLASQPNLQGGELISYDLGGTTWNSISTKVSDLLTTSSNIGDLNDVNAPSPESGSVIYYSAHNQKYSTAGLYTLANLNNLIDNTLTDTASNKFAHAGKVAQLLGEKQATITNTTVLTLQDLTANVVSVSDGLKWADADIGSDISFSTGTLTINCREKAYIPLRSTVVPATSTINTINLQNVREGTQVILALETTTDASVATLSSTVSLQIDGSNATPYHKNFTENITFEKNANDLLMTMIILSGHIYLTAQKI